MARLTALFKRFQSIVILTIFFLVVSAFPSSFVVKSNPLLIFQWNKRLLVLVTPSANNKKYVKQMKMIKNKPLGIEDRDIHVVKIIDKKFLGVSKKHGNVGGVLEVLGLYKLDGNKFSILLIGKDGEEKARFVEPLSMCVFFDLIDSMPMRQNEISESRKNIKC